MGIAIVDESNLVVPGSVIDVGIYILLEVAEVDRCVMRNTSACVAAIILVHIGAAFDTVGHRVGLKTVVWFADDIWARRIKVTSNLIPARISFIGESGRPCFTYWYLPSLMMEKLYCGHRLSALRFGVATALAAV